MAIQADLFSILYFLVLTVYGMIGTYALSLNPKASLNRVFFLICLSLCIWAFSFSIGNVAIYYETALLWRRIASFGWGILYSLLVHFFLLLTDATTFLKLRVTFILIYLPAVLNLIFYGIYGPVAILQYSLMQIESGWINTSVGGFGDLFFNTYYTLFSFVGLIVLWSWKGLSKDATKKKTAIIVSTTFFIGFISGTSTDMFINQYLDFYTPQLGVVFAIIPILGIFYSIQRHGLMLNREISNVNEKEILSLNHRMKIYDYLTIAIICGSVLNIGHYFYYTVDIASVLLTSTIFMFMGLITKMISLTSFSKYKQDMMLFVTLSILTFMLLWRFLFEDGSNIVWTIPIIFLLVTAVFRDRKFFFYMLFVTLLFHLWSWIKVPVVEVTVNNINYLSHMTLYMLVAVLVFYINQTYFQRLDDHEKQTELQKKISEISSAFVSVTIDNLDDKISDMLKKSGEYFEVDRAYMFRFSEDMSMAECTNEWWNESSCLTINTIGSQPTASFPWWMKELEQNRKVYIECVEHLPNEASADREFLMRQGVKSLISAPVFKQSRLIGFLGYDAVRDKTWSFEQQEALQIMINIVSDALVKVETEKEINFMAYYDALTGLLNRTYFNLQLNKKIERARRKKKFIGILFLDLDEFKSINDTMGHDSGDKLLIEVAKRLSQSVRKADKVCRFGGDEFLVMLSSMDDPAHIQIATRKIMEAFDKPIKIKEQDFYVTASCGVAIYPLDGLDAETLIKSADLAMYESKESGKNRYAFCTPLMKEAVNEKMQLSNDLYTALEREELVLYYQPQVHIETGNIIGLEALIRWNHPDRGIISPGIFIPLAEQTGLIHKIGEWVVKTACIQNKVWQSKGFSPVVMAVNLSVEQFRGNKLVEVVSNALTESKLESKYLELEITESIAIKEPTYIIGILHKLKALGVSISIDDFGIEYSSLSRLKELPIDRLKMAMEFVQGIENGAKDEAIAVVIINLAKSLGLKVIAEGVEDEGQVAFLKARVCDEVQGFYFYYPMPAKEIEQILPRIT